MAKVLIIGASGQVGTKLVKEFDKNSNGVELVLGTSREETAQKWREEGREAVILDLNKSEGFEVALAGVDRIFLLTGYTSDMLIQSKRLVDVAVASGVSHIVHLGVFTSREDLIPHFVWHDLIETYIEASKISWTHIHPNVISDSILVTNPPIVETGSFTVNWGEAKQGWVFAEDIAAVSAAVLREGPEKHGSKNYYLSTEVLTGPEVAGILTEVSGREIKCNVQNPESIESFIAQIPNPGARAYMESAAITMKLAKAGQMQAQTVVRDDVLTVLGRPGTTTAEWANNYFNDKK